MCCGVKCNIPRPRTPLASPKTTRHRHMARDHRLLKSAGRVYLMDKQVHLNPSIHLESSPRQLKMEHRLMFSTWGSALPIKKDLHLQRRSPKR
jgi:hypothetical protein